MQANEAVNTTLFTIFCKYVFEIMNFLNTKYELC